MTWSDAFPILTDELYDEYLASAPKKLRREAAGWFAEQQTINPRDVRHIVSVSLFWKNISSHQPDIVIRDRADFMAAGKRRNLLRFEPWSHYVKPLLEGAYRLHATRDDAAFRVYLAADLEFLQEDLVEAGCEVRLMKSSSIRHNPGAMWRFLAFAETGKLITVVDADRAERPERDLARTEAMAQSGLHWWRVPVWGELNEIGNVSYRPFIGLQMGSTGGLTEVSTMMEALVWASQAGKIETYAKLPGCTPKPVHGTVWPDYGFDEWFLLSSIYPRAAYDGILTFVPSNAKSRLLTLDVQYASKANKRSEIHYFGSPGADCCGPLEGRTPGPRSSNRRVLLTGIWQVATANDVALITEFYRHARAQDLTVELKPVLHVRAAGFLKRLPDELVKAAIHWTDLKYNVSVQHTLLHAICHGTEADWIWQADSDERVDFACVGGLAKAVMRADHEGVDYVDGEWVDRIGWDDRLRRVSQRQSLAIQFPRPVLAVTELGKARQRKIALHRRDCLTSIGNHDAETPHMRAAKWSIPIWHFKWHSDCLPNQQAKLGADANHNWSNEMAQLVGKLEQEGGRTVKWSELPPRAWPRVKASWRRGDYPVGRGVAQSGRRRRD